MREEVKNWLTQAKEDFFTAETLIKSERFYASIFFSQQAAEKSLKALVLEKTRENITTHNLLSLVDKSKSAPHDIKEAARRLNTMYTITRYVDAANGVPAEQFGKEEASHYLSLAKKVLTWVKQSITTK